LETIERELRELQECLKNSEGKEVEKSPAVLRSMSPDDSSLDIPETNYSLEHLTASLRNHNSGTTPRSIAGVELDDSMVADLLQEYVHAYLGSPGADKPKVLFTPPRPIPALTKPRGNSRKLQALPYIILDSYGPGVKRPREVCTLVPSATRPYQAFGSGFYHPSQSINLLHTRSLTSLHLAIPFQCRQRRPLMAVLRTCDPYGYATRLASSAAPVQAPERR
jgi:hypothetical protein